MSDQYVVVVTPDEDPYGGFADPECFGPFGTEALAWEFDQELFAQDHYRMWATTDVVKLVDANPQKGKNDERGTAGPDRVRRVESGGRGHLLEPSDHVVLRTGDGVVMTADDVEVTITGYRSMPAPGESIVVLYGVDDATGDKLTLAADHRPGWAIVEALNESDCVSAVVPEFMILERCGKSWAVKP